MKSLDTVKKENADDNSPLLRCWPLKTLEKLFLCGEKLQRRIRRADLSWMRLYGKIIIVLLKAKEHHSIVYVNTPYPEEHMEGTRSLQLSVEVQDTRGVEVQRAALPPRLLSGGGCAIAGENKA